jgi:mono/diheme cytochrome c family protein
MRYNRSNIDAALVVLLCATGVVYGQGGGGRGRGGNAPATGAGAQGAAASTVVTTPNPVTGLPPIGRPAYDEAAAERGKALWSAQCITCHGTNARGTDSGPNLVRSDTANYDRFAIKPGDVLGPFLKKGHPTQSGKPSASFTDEEVDALANFIRRNINETMRGSPTYIVLPENVLTGDVKVGEADFQEFNCGQCHNGNQRNLNGIATRINNPQTLQGMVLYPGAAGGRGGRGGPGGGRGGAPAAPTGNGNPPGPQPPNPLAMKVTITRPGGTPITGTLVDQDAFFLTYSDSSGTLQTLRKTPDMKITTENPMQWHADFADRVSDKQMHDLTAYLWSLK